MRKIEILDTTLRDGAQGEGISFSVEDKLKIVTALDRLGIDFIEAGNPFSNPKDERFFREVRELSLTHAHLVAFGTTRKRGVSAQEDANCAALLNTGAEYIAIVGKSSDWQAREVLGVSPEENLQMISDTVRYLCAAGKQVIFDAEHFFDGYRQNAAYALKTLRAAADAGAFRLVLCDTNGGTFPEEIKGVVSKMCAEFPGKIGVHCHDDIGCAVAGTLAAAGAGAGHVQGTYIGIGERCGNTNLSTAIGNLQLKSGYDCIPAENMRRVTKTARLIAEICNVRLPSSSPYVGKSAFAHKGGMHADGVVKNPAAFEHIDPQAVGNRRNFLLSEVGGRATLLDKLGEFVPDIGRDSPELSMLVEKLKSLEYDGYQFEAATASFELIVLKELGRFTPFFGLELFRIIDEPDIGVRNMASAMVKVKVGDRYEVTADEGNGPVHAIDKALRKALEVFYPSLSDVKLKDFKVRVMDSGKATASLVRVLIESGDGDASWTTVGVSTDIINASVKALTDSIEYKLLHDSRQQN